MNTYSFSNSHPVCFVPGTCQAFCGPGLPKPQGQCPFCQISGERAASQGPLHLWLRRLGLAITRRSLCSDNPGQ